MIDHRTRSGTPAAARRAQALLPVVTDLRLLRDDLLNQAQTLTDGLTRDQMAALLASFAGVVELSLERCGVTVLPVTAGRHSPPADTRRPRSNEPPTRLATVASDGSSPTATRRSTTGRVIAPARVTVHRSESAEEGA